MTTQLQFIIIIIIIIIIKYTSLPYELCILSPIFSFIRVRWMYSPIISMCVYSKGQLLMRFVF